MALREIFAHFGFSFDQAALKNTSRAVDNVRDKAKHAGAGLTHVAEGLKAAFAGFLAGEVAHITNEIAEQADQVAKLSQQLGIGTDNMQAWSLAAGLAGADSAEFTGGLRKLSAALAGTTADSKDTIELFKKLGVTTKDGNGEARQLDDILPDVAEGFKNLTNGTEKAALASQLFGRSGLKLLPLLNQGTEGAKKLKEEFVALGGGFSPEALKNAEEYNDSITRLQFSFFSLKSQLLTSVYPSLQKTIDSITHGVVAAGKWLHETTALGTGIKILAALLTGKLALALAPYLLPGLKFLAIFLAVDDLIAFLEGKDSVIGAILNHWFGDGTATVVRKWCNSAKDAIVGTFVGALDLLKLALADTDAESDKVWEHFVKATNPVADAIDRIVAGVKQIYAAFTDWDNVKGNVNDLLDLVTSPFDTEADKEQKRKRRADSLNARADAAIAANPLSKAVVNPAHEALANAYANIAGGVAAPPSIRALDTRAAATVNNISPITVQQTFGPGTGPEVRKIAKDAATAGVKQGLADYRAALQSLEQRAP